MIFVFHFPDQCVENHGEINFVEIIFARFTNAVCLTRTGGRRHPRKTALVNESPGFGVIATGSQSICDKQINDVFPSSCFIKFFGSKIIPQSNK